MHNRWFCPKGYMAFSMPGKMHVMNAVTTVGRASVEWNKANSGWSWALATR